MKILFVTSTLTSGGSERVMSILANELRTRGHDVTIVCLNKPLNFYTLNNDVDVRYTEKEVHSKCLLKKMKWLREFSHQYNPDVAIPFMTAVYCVTILSLIGTSIPIIASERNDPRKTPWVRKLFRMVLLPLANILIVQTTGIKEYFPKFIKKRIVVIYNPVSDYVFNLPTPIVENRILSIGKLYPQKNQKMLIEAFSKVADIYKDLELYIYGEGPLRPQLTDLIQKLNLKDRVFLPGVVDNIIGKMNNSKLFCMTSNYEGMSNALIEAVCVGLPIITTDVSGAKEIIDNGVNGEIVGVGEIDELAATISRLLSDEERMKRYSEVNRSKAEMFRKESIVDQWLNVINKVVMPN